jgi:hypothetical protein
MKQLLIIASVICLQVTGRAQFPASWIGTYSGQMKLLNIGKPSDSVLVTLEIHEVMKDSAWSYRMVFHHKTYGDMVKDYQINKNNAGAFYMDENNGILIPMTFLDGCFYECYEVDGMLFHSTMRLQEKDIYYELIGTPYKSAVSRDLGDEKEGSYTVRSYRPGVIQKVLLIKN